MALLLPMECVLRSRSLEGGGVCEDVRCRPCGIVLAIISPGLLPRRSLPKKRNGEEREGIRDFFGVFGLSVLRSLSFFLLVFGEFEALPFFSGRLMSSALENLAFASRLSVGVMDMTLMLLI